MPGARLAKNCLLWHYIRFLCLFFFKGKEKLKSPLRIGRWMCLAWKSREEHLRRSKVPGKGTSDCCRITSMVACTFPASLGDTPDQRWPPSQHPNQASLPGLTQSLRYPAGSYFGWGIFWLVYLCALLSAVLIAEGWGLRLRAPDTPREGHFPWGMFFLLPQPFTGR